MLRVPGFEGALDGLLQRVQARQIDLGRLSIAALIEAYADAMQHALRTPPSATLLAAWAGWTVMAAQLAELRSRLLLPADDPVGQAARHEADGLRRAWLDRAAMHAAADWLERRPQLGRDSFGRGRPEPDQGRAGQRNAPWYTRACEQDASADIADDPDEAGEGDLTGLLRACLVALKLPADIALYQPQRLPFWSVAEASRRIQTLLPGLTCPVSLQGFLPESQASQAGPGKQADGLHRRAALAATLLASLELAKEQTLTLDQQQPWTTILLS